MSDPHVRVVFWAPISDLELKTCKRALVYISLHKLQPVKWQTTASPTFPHAAGKAMASELFGYCPYGCFHKFGAFSVGGLTIRPRALLFGVYIRENSPPCFRLPYHQSMGPPPRTPRLTLCRQRQGPRGLQDERSN